MIPEPRCSIPAFDGSVDESIRLRSPPFADELVWREPHEGLQATTENVCVDEVLEMPEQLIVVFAVEAFDLAPGNGGRFPGVTMIETDHEEASASRRGASSREDGKRYKSLKRHLGVRGLTPEEYRAKWNLPADYPMVAPNYAAARSALAKSQGLGRNPSPKAKPGRARIDLVGRRMPSDRLRGPPQSRLSGTAPSPIE